jgi:hypothetical protein
MAVGAEIRGQDREAGGGRRPGQQGHDVVGAGLGADVMEQEYVEPCVLAAGLCRRCAGSWR